MKEARPCEGAHLLLIGDDVDRKAAAHCHVAPKMDGQQVRKSRSVTLR